MPIAKEDILSEIRNFVAKHRKPPGELAFRSATRTKDSDWKRYWVRWGDVLKEAGFEPNTWTQRIPDDQILGRLAVFVTKLGHFPVRGEINIESSKTEGFPHSQTIKKRFGGMPEIAAALLEFGKQTGDAHLVDLCEQRLKREGLKPTPTGLPKAMPAAKAGYVYLKYSPSLRLYRIGKGDNPDKRGLGLSVLLPEDLVAKHEIKTDYPYVLEKYWHNRFREKKKQGEWFDLNSQDISAFKTRRQFMFSEFFP
jgi:hypothetical protein